MASGESIELLKRLSDSYGAVGMLESQNNLLRLKLKLTLRQLDLSHRRVRI